MTDPIDRARRLGELLGFGVGPVVAEHGDEWRPATELVDPADATVTELIDHVAATRRAPDRATATALSWKQAAYGLSALLVGTWAATGTVLDMRLANLVFRVHPDSKTPELALRAPRWFATDDRLGPVWRELFDPLEERWRAEARVGRRALRSLSATAVAQITSHCAPGGLADKHATIDRLFAALPPEFRTMVPMAEIREPGQAGWQPYAMRTACCLAYKVPPAKYCSNCNLIDDAARTELLDRFGYQWRACPT